MQLLEKISLNLRSSGWSLTPVTPTCLSTSVSVFHIPIANLPPALCFPSRITSRSSFLWWEDSWRQQARARGSPMARAAVEEARLGAVALLDNMALTTTIIRALALELEVQVVLGSRLAEEELLAQ